MSFVVFERFREPVRRQQCVRVSLKGKRDMRVDDDHEIKVDVMIKTIEAAALRSLSHNMNEQIINALGQLQEDILILMRDSVWRAGEGNREKDIYDQIDTLIQLLSSGVYLLQPEKILNGD